MDRTDKAATVCFLPLGGIIKLKWQDSLYHVTLSVKDSQMGTLSSVSYMTFLQLYK